MNFFYFCVLMLALILFHACCIFHIKKKCFFIVGVVCYNICMRLLLIIKKIFKVCMCRFNACIRSKNEDVHFIGQVLTCMHSHICLSSLLPGEG